MSDGYNNAIALMTDRFGGVEGVLVVVPSSIVKPSDSIPVFELSETALADAALPSNFPSSVSGVYLRRVLEKSPNPAKLLASIAGRISGDGFILLESSEEQCDSGDLVRFTEAGLSRLASDCGCDIDPRPQRWAGVTLRILRPRRTVGRETVRSSARRRAVILNTYYTGFIESFYRARPDLLTAEYRRQLEALTASRFGDSDFYSAGLIAAGWDATDFIVNCAPLQDAWAREHGSELRGWPLFVEQLRSIRPDVLYIQDTHCIDSGIMELLRPECDVIVGQLASTPPATTPWNGFDFIVSSLPGLVGNFRAAGITAYYQPLAFEPRVLESLNVPEFGDRTIECSFVGSLNTDCHSARYKFLDELSNKLPLRIWGAGGGSLPHDSAIGRRWEGEAWGLDMFGRLAQSRITLNFHAQTLVTDPRTGARIDAGANYANNMRLFEATACGSLLITEYRDNLNDLFEIGTEVVAYRSTDECVGLVKYYLEHPDEAAKIAAAGRARTLRDHTYAQRMVHSAELFELHLRHRDAAKRQESVDLSKISYGHRAIGKESVRAEHTEAWKDQSIPAKQRALVQNEIQRMFKGDAPASFQALASVCAPLTRMGTKLLEIGCASGYYYEILQYLLSKRIEYWGVDYSEAMIDLAREFYPKANFTVADGANLPFADREFPIVVSSCVLLHVPNYEEHLAETVRVASDAVILHRTPVSLRKPTGYETKYAYGVETVELTFNEDELFSICRRLGLRPDGGVELDADPARDFRQRTYRFRREP